MDDTYNTYGLSYPANFCKAFGDVPSGQYTVEVCDSVPGDDGVLEQVEKQLEKIVTVVEVIDVGALPNVERDLMLIKVRSETGVNRSEIRELVDIFRGRIVDVGASEIMIEISGREQKIQAFIERMRVFGITELARTGRIAMIRSDSVED